MSRISQGKGAGVGQKESFAWLDTALIFRNEPSESRPLVIVCRRRKVRQYSGNQIVLDVILIEPRFSIRLYEEE